MRVARGVGGGEGGGGEVGEGWEGAGEDLLKGELVAKGSCWEGTNGS